MKNNLRFYSLNYRICYSHLIIQGRQDYLAPYLFKILHETVYVLCIYIHI